MSAALRPPAVTAAAVLLIVVGADTILAGIWFAGTLLLGHGGPCGCFFCGVCPVLVAVGAAVIREAIRLWNGGPDDVAGAGGVCIAFGVQGLLLVGFFGYDLLTPWQATGWAVTEQLLREAAMVAVALANAVAVIVAGGLLCRSGRRYAAWRDESPKSAE